MEYMLNFADQREDVVLYHLLKDVDISSIRYIDVGAGDPMASSVTKLFYDRGACGINIEPQRDCADKLRKDRPRDINLAVGISDKAGELTLYGEGGVASFDRNNQWAGQEIVHIVPVRTLSDVCAEYVSTLGGGIHFLKIDAEGWERQCLEGMDFVRFRPWILCIESTLPFSTISCHEDWEELILEQNYLFIGDTHLNRYYVASEKRNEIRAFCHPHELDAFYKIVYVRSCYQYSFDQSILLQERKVVLFGAGAVGQDYWRQSKKAGLPFAAWIASYPQEGLPVNTLESLDGLMYDVILVGVKEEGMAKEIRAVLNARGVPDEKILWRPPIQLY